MISRKNVQFAYAVRQLVFVLVFFFNLNLSNESKFHGFGNLPILLSKSFGNFFKDVCTNPVLLNMVKQG